MSTEKLRQDFDDELRATVDRFAQKGFSKAVMANICGSMFRTLLIESSADDWLAEARRELDPATVHRGKVQSRREDPPIVAIDADSFLTTSWPPIPEQVFSQLKIGDRVTFRIEKGYAVDVQKATR